VDESRRFEYVRDESSQGILYSPPNIMNQILEIELIWGHPKGSWGVEIGSFLCEKVDCEGCEFRFACYTIRNVAVKATRKFDDLDSAMNYKYKLRKRFHQVQIKEAI